MGLHDLDPQQLEKACMRALRESKFFPRPVELRQLAGTMPINERAIVAWGEVAKAVRGYGSYASVDFDDPVINASIRNMGGWQQLCAKSAEDFDVWCRKDFERIYAALCSSCVTEDAACYLVGRHEQLKQSAGYSIDQPARIATSLPPHDGQVVRRLSPPERLALLDGRVDTTNDALGSLVSMIAAVES